VILSLRYVINGINFRGKIMYLDEEKSRVIACEIGYAVLMLLKKGEPVSQENISFLLENKRTEVDDVLHKLLLKGTAQLIRNGFED